MSQCVAKGLRVKFTKEECVRTLSSLNGGNLTWAQSAMGPSAEGCQLMFPVF